MKYKCKFLIVLAFIIMTFGMGGCGKQDDAEFDTEFTQCKAIIQDTSKAITDNESSIVEAFEMKYLDSTNYNSDTQFNKEFLPFLKSKMTEALTSKNVNYIDRLSECSRILTINNNEETTAIRDKLDDRSSELLPYSDRHDTDSTTTVAPPTAPTIGMTSAEVDNSTWGEPTSKNITTTASGTDEQWVYPNYQYVYIENGVVTAVSTH